MAGINIENKNAQSPGIVLGIEANRYRRVLRLIALNEDLGFVGLLSYLLKWARGKSERISCILQTNIK